MGSAIIDPVKGTGYATSVPFVFSVFARFGFVYTVHLSQQGRCNMGQHVRGMRCVRSSEQVNKRSESASCGVMLARRFRVRLQGGSILSLFFTQLVHLQV
jgi:ribosomal protein L37E